MIYKVIIADDDELMCRAMTAAISRFDQFEVVSCVGNGEDAVEICRNKDINLVFMDIALPGMTGIEAARVISKISPATETIIVSVLSSFEVIKQTLTSKIRDYLVKPISFSDIDQLLKGYLDDQAEDLDLSLRLLTQVREKAYQDMIGGLPELVHKVFLGSNQKKDTVYHNCLQIAGYVLSEAVPEVYKDLNLTETFPVNRMYIGEESAWILWFTDVIDYLFRQIIIQKYDYLKPVFAYIDAEIKNDISLTSICDVCSISQSYLSRLFRRYFNMSVMDYVHRQKILKAKKYILFTDYSITQIGHLIGYYDGSYFSKVFKKYEGMSPKQFKVAYSGDGIRGEELYEKHG